MKDELSYVLPESVGISSKAVEKLVSELDRGATQPHGLMMVRHGQVFAEGYWKPYAKGLLHGMQSLSKTYAGTAVGIAVQQGLVGLDERIIDIFPREAEDIRQPYLEELLVRHVLSMSTGMRKMSGFEGDWIVNFLNNPIVDRPGSRFFYNSVGSTLLGEIIRRRSGAGLNEFLCRNLYEKIGMNPDEIKWLCLEDGLEVGGSGLYTTLHNNTRLGLLYMNNGRWGDEQIIDREFCRLASTKQIDNAREDGIPSDGHMGYGFQMWMGLHTNTYCMCGALGQYTLMCPDEDIVISFTGRTNDAVQAASDVLMGKFWEFLDTGVDKRFENSQDAGQTTRIMPGLSLPPEPYQPCGKREGYTGKWCINEGSMDLDMTTGGIMRPYYRINPVDWFEISFCEDEVRLVFHNRLGSHVLHAGMDGLARLNRIETPPFPCSKVNASAAFLEGKLVFFLRWIETCYSASLCLEKTENGLTIVKKYDEVDPEGTVDTHRAEAIRME